MRFALSVVLAAALTGGCKLEKLPPAGPFSDDFNRDTLGAEWSATGGNWRLVNGELVIDHGYNHPLWLKRPIPDDAVVELDCWSNDDAGDINRFVRHLDRTSLSCWCRDLAEDGRAMGRNIRQKPSDH